jgi:heat shock protein HslJ
VLGGTAWDLATFKGSGASATPAASGASAPLAFTSDTKVNGSTGCNQFSGTYTESGDSVKIELGAMTQKACADAAVNAQESALVALFPQVTGFNVDAGTLTLTGSGGATLLTYTAGLGGLEGTAWQATGVNNGKGGVESTALTESLTATFDPSGAFSGFGGCNSLSGTYKTSGSNGLTITNLVGTKISCGGETDALETQYTAALEAVSTYEIAGNQLTLRNSAGAIQASYTRTG